MLASVFLTILALERMTVALVRAEGVAFGFFETSFVLTGSVTKMG